MQDFYIYRMAVNLENYKQIISELNKEDVTLIAVSKTKPASDIQLLYDLGQRDFGENYVQELIEKQPLLPEDIRWHFIGHLQSNKVKYIAPFVHLIHGIDSKSLLKEVSKQGIKNNKTIDVLLQMHIAQEETKFGMNEQELEEAMSMIGRGELPGIRAKGLMGMASFTKNIDLVREEFQHLKKCFDEYATNIPSISILSMGMSGDYKLALEEGSNMVRIGSLLFGERTKKNDETSK